MTMPKKGKALAKPYEPTPQEAAAVARHDRRKLTSPQLPGLKSDLSEPDESGTRVANISMDHPDLSTAHTLIADAIGSADWAFVSGLLNDASGVAVKHDGGPDLERANYALSIVKGLKPRDQVEATADNLESSGDDQETISGSLARCLRLASSLAASTHDLVELAKRAGRQ